MTRIVGVHGVLQYRPGDPLRAGEAIAAAWAEELGPDSGAVVEVAYYADLVRKPGAYGEPLNVDRLDADAWSTAAAYLAAALPDLTHADGRLRVSPRTAMGILAGRRGLNGAATHGSVVAFARETARFLRDHGTAGTREAVTARVARRIAGADVVVAHSLGAVVAYETLWRHSPIAIPMLITIGSPLAIPGAVFPRLSPPTMDGRRPKPPNVDRWIDVLDPRDLFAVPGGEVGARFDDVVAHQDRVPGFDAHRPGGYLRAEPVRTALLALDLVHRTGSGQIDGPVEG
ncbi:hypothetical protein [Phytomonospora endophytica]|uniref:Serine peptidase n=1 Tax=Phytomonospora endophytica TaxID=714109 RepID=A0A841FZN7_9ACTN|nr:hypothetical protein [Phytomonospora endophytica]MBB6039168.1 hypothetical protein [Phytomonospora endophytica]